MQPHSKEIPAPDGEVWGGAYLLAYLEAGGEHGLHGWALGSLFFVCSRDADCHDVQGVGAYIHAVPLGTH